MRNSCPSTRASPLERCSSVIQWCISSGVSALHCSTRFAVIMTKAFDLKKKKKISFLSTVAGVTAGAASHLSGLSEAQTESIIPTSNVP